MGQKDKEYYQQHREEILQRARERYAAEPELRQRVKDTWKIWAKKNPDKLREAHRKYRETYKDEISQRARAKRGYYTPSVGPRLPKRVPRARKEPKPQKTLKVEAETKTELIEAKQEPLPKIRFDGPVTLDESAWL